MKLYEITATYQDFLNAVESGEIPEEAIADTLEGLDGVFEEKADNIACMIKSLLADAAAIKAERASLEARQKAAEKAADRMKDYLSNAMQTLGKTKLETARNALYFRKSTGLHIDLGFADNLTEEQRNAFLRHKEPEVDKTAVKNALKAGETIPGAWLEDKQNLQIK